MDFRCSFFIKNGPFVRCRETADTAQRDAEEDDDENEDEEDHGALYEVTCPNCGEISTLDEETLMDPEGDLVCPHCGATFDIELEGTEEDSAEETDKQDR